jgi:hypothetical protein
MRLGTLGSSFDAVDSNNKSNRQDMHFDKPCESNDTTNLIQGRKFYDTLLLLML